MAWPSWNRVLATDPNGRLDDGARYPSGKGEVCKTFMRRFDPDPRLQYSQCISSGISCLPDKVRSFWFVLNRPEWA
jgi:hypothetical protein